MRATWSQWFLSNIIFLFNLHVLSISFLVCISLWFIHSYFMLTNSTTWEKAARRKITYLKSLGNDSYNPFNEGYLRNICQFLCYCQDIQWDNSYKRFLERFQNSANKFTQFHNNAASTTDESNEEEVNATVQAATVASRAKITETSLIESPTTTIIQLN
jgi:hypothetical protein